MKTFAVILFVLLLLVDFAYGQTIKPLRIGIHGLTHTHVHGLLGRKPAADVVVVGIAEPNRALAERYARQYGFDLKLVYPTLEEMVAKTKPEAVAAFNAIAEHLATVQYCAPRGIHVMVEKPLAVSVAHATQMAELTRKHKTLLLTNYETTWYPSHHRAYALVNDEVKVGALRKMVFHHGHKGPIEIGCNAEFLDFLTDSVRNGGGALPDFGCYGANLATWLLKGQTPVSVSCITQHFKPELYPQVEDEATIIVTYPKTQVIIQASWNWPFARKDMELYGKTGVILCPDGKSLTIRASEKEPAPAENPAAMPSQIFDPFAYLAGRVHGSIKVSDYDLSELKNNELVVKILEMAKQSSQSGKVVMWKD